MRILLDSHTLLWWLEDPAKLLPSAVAAISNPENLVYISAVSIWEIGLKISKGKLKLPPDLPFILLQNGLEHLPFTAAHALASLSLPAIHGDPFDRALIAQCQTESMTFATRDGILDQYGIAILRV